MQDLSQTRTGVATEDRSSTSAPATAYPTGFARASVVAATADGRKVLPASPVARERRRRHHGREGWMES